MNQIIECVPNFSEGANMETIKAITNAIQSVQGITLLNTDPGLATNRTVVTFVGAPALVIEAAFRAIKTAGERIDMSVHKGEHPRMGATDVCPLIPIANITMEETAAFAVALAKRVGEELAIPVYLYEAAQPNKKRANLADIRAGEYEGFSDKIKKAEWKPDFGPVIFDRIKGATVIGARDFLVAYNINLNTTSVRRANAIAFDVREAGRVQRENNDINGKIMTDADGQPLHVPGSLKSVKAIGWFIEEYGIAQISMNLTDINVTPVHIAFDEVVTKAADRGIRVTGSELVGLIPLKAMTDAGKYFLKKQQRSAGVSEKELIRIAIKSLGLDELSPFDPQERIIEYVMQRDENKSLLPLSLEAFSDETASESPAPGGGSVAAYVGALGIALSGMVANLSAHKKGWDDRWEEFSKAAEQGETLRKEMLALVDADTQAFNTIMEAFSLPKKTEEEKSFRSTEIQKATKTAIEIPMRVMQVGSDSMGLIRAMVETGNPNSVSDAGVGALCVRSAVMGAYLNVRINAASCKDKDYVEKVLAKGQALQDQVITMESQILELVSEKIAQL